MASRMSKRFTGFLSKSKNTTPTEPSTDNSYVFDTGPADSTESEVVRNIRLFCESGSTTNGEEEVLYLPAVVELADASPKAAAAAAQQIRLFLNRDWAVKPHVQYNAVMLVRILSDHPGAVFTKNFDKAFVSTVKEVLRMCRDDSTQQILRETLDSLEYNKRSQEGVEGLITMWRKEKGSKASISNAGSNYRGQRGFQNDFAYGYPAGTTDQRPSLGDHRHSSRHQLPPPAELASRIEEAKNSAKILLQLVQSTPSEEVIHNELLREFSDRCSSAQKSMAGYIACDNPPPDDETMLTLIETNEQLSLAASRYQRAILNARKAMGGTPSPNAEAMQNSAKPAYVPPVAPLSKEQSLFAPAAPRSPPAASLETPGLGVSAFSNASTNEGFQAPSGPPPRQSTQHRVLPNDTSAFPAPYSAPAQQSVQQDAFANSSNGAYSSPPSPPTAMLARLNSRGSHPSPTQFSPKPVSDPFADPVGKSQNSATIPGEKGIPVPSTTLQHPANRPYSNTFDVDAGPTYAPRSIQTSPADDDDDDHYNASPVLTRTGSGFNEPVSPVSLTQPSPPSSSQRRWQDLRATASYMGRQTSATEGLTMHGAQADPAIGQVDGYSNVERATQPQMLRTDTQESDHASSAYSVTPSQTRT